MVTLSSLKPGTKAKIVEINACPYKCRFMALGIVPDETVLLSRKSLFKKTICVEVNGTTIALRKEEANLIKVSISTTK